MGDRGLIATGVIGAAVAAVCCATPLLAVLFGAVGLTAWLAKADYVVIPALVLCLALIAFGLYRRRMRPR
jgi:mercuric ion transport protein